MKIIAKVLSVALILLPFSAYAAHDVDINVNATVGAHSDDTKAETEDGVSITPTSGDAEVGVSGVTVVTSTTSTASAGEDEQFTAFASLMTTTNANVNAVDVQQDGSVDVAYNHQGYLFGFIPVVVTSHTTVTADDSGKPTARVRMPWWSFLVRGVAKVRGDAEASLNTDANVRAHVAQNSTESRIKLAEDIVLSLNKAAKANAAASAAASTTDSDN